MSETSKTITLSMPMGMGSVNCYLLKGQIGFLLIDTGISNQRSALEVELEGAGCMPGDIKLIVITHGDFDHTGNAAYLRNRYGGEIGMHPYDADMAVKGDMFAGRRKGSRLLSWLSAALMGFGESKRFRPDVFLEDGTDLSGYGLEARIVSIPGHSQGSIGVLTASGDLYCGDLFENRKEPALNSLIDDLKTARDSLERLRGLAVKTVYPGHGQSFLLEQLKT